MDCSFVAKSGKATFGLDAFWNGCVSRVETGLEISVVGVVDVETEQGYAVSAEQTYAQSSLPEFSRMISAGWFSCWGRANRCWLRVFSKGNISLDLPLRQ